MCTICRRMMPSVEHRLVFRLVLRVVPVLLLLGMLPVLLIRAQPYHDRAVHALVSDSCDMPCFLHVRPGVTTLSDAVGVVAGHEWVANGPLGFPAPIRDAVQFGSVVPRMQVDLRWTDNLPVWIDDTQNGILSVEDQRVLGLMISTHLSLGEIFLAFGEPDEQWYASSGIQQFLYSAWYAKQGLFITGQGMCPTRRYYNFPVEIAFRPDRPQILFSESEIEVC
jgi:hypothetical protein